MLNEPNQESPAQQAAYDTLRTDKPRYDQNIVDFCKHHRAEDFRAHVMELIRSGTYRTAAVGAPVSRRRDDEVVDL